MGVEIVQHLKFMNYVVGDLFYLPNTCTTNQFLRESEGDMFLYFCGGLQRILDYTIHLFRLRPARNRSVVI